MKIRVTLQTKASADFAFDVVASPSETVASIKEKAASAAQIPFSEQELCFDGKSLADESKLRECGIVDGSSLHFIVKATQSTLAQQLVTLLQARDLSVDEIGLLYCYKYGASVNEAFKIVGFEGQLQDFVENHKSWSVNNGLISLKRDGGKEGASAAPPAAPPGLGAAPPGLSGAPSPPLPPGLAGGSAPSPPGLCGGQSADVAEEEGIAAVDGHDYLELHNKISSRTFNSQATQRLNDLVGALSDSSFLDIDHVAVGGSIGKGTSISGVATAEVVLFLRGLPTVGVKAWQPSLLKAVAGVLSEDFSLTHGIEDVKVTESCIKMCISSPIQIAVDLYLSPAFESYLKAVQLVGKQSPEARKFYALAFAKERTQFVARQPASVKMTIRLMKWWRDQQDWYGCLARPSDELLELTAIYSAIQTKPTDQKVAIANLMSLLSRFNQMRVVWSNYYNKDDVPSALVRQRPLLMDPTNPFVNVADPQTFDASELMVLARETRFFW